MAIKAVSIQLEDKTLERLAYIAAATGRHRDGLITEAINQYVAQESQSSGVTKAISAADRGQLVEHAIVKAKWLTRQAAGRS
ncbi:ribbon-helix-helix protein, CopG family [Porticoccaceae bacterium]|nr:ribbon-helix-helix protein, CopG family [Porticoccaceae bacterium]